MRTLVVACLLAACGPTTPAIAPATGPTASTPSAAIPGTPAALTTPPPTTPVALHAADVTMIWPLPTTDAEREHMLAATTVGAHGELLPAALYKLPVLDERDYAVKDPAVDRARLRVVAARLDPCFASFAAPTEPSCINQVRLVLQVLRPGGGTAGGAASNTVMGANDGAVHVFYQLSRDELLGLTRSLAALRDRHGTTDAPTLGVHPLLAREGLASAYARELQALLLTQLGAKRLTRITFFARTRAREPLWPFGIFEVIDGKPVAQKIVNLGSERQTLEGAGPRFVMQPAVTGADSPGALLSLFGAARTATAAERAAFAAVLRIQNPAKHTPDTVACAECHAAQRVQAHAQRMLGLRAEDFADDHYASTVAAPPLDTSAENFHATGYLATHLAVSTRAANETAAVLAAMRSLLAAR
jgi:hypothetical protein